MNPSRLLYDMLRSEGIDFFVSLPCVMLAEFIFVLESEHTITHVPVAREEEGIGIATGAFLGGKEPAVVMQNSGLGNSINAIVSLARYYAVPLVLVVSHRGTRGEKVDAQRPMGEATSTLLASAKVPFTKIAHAGQLDSARRLVRRCYEEERPVALLLPIQFWSLQS